MCHNGCMSPFAYIAASLWQYRRTHLAVAAGVAGLALGWFAWSRRGGRKTGE